MRVPDWQVDGTMAKARRDALIRALVECDYCLDTAAAFLRIGRSTVYRLVNSLEIEVPRRPSTAVRVRPPAPRIVYSNGDYLLVHR